MAHEAPLWLPLPKAVACVGTAVGRAVVPVVIKIQLALQCTLATPQVSSCAMENSCVWHNCCYRTTCDIHMSESGNPCSAET